MSHTKPSLEDTLGVLEPAIPTIIDEHTTAQEKRGYWQPSELIPSADELPDLPPELGGLLVLNSTTEDGLPNFFGLLVTNVSYAAEFLSWINIWTAEENRHGVVINKYLDRTMTREQLIGLEGMKDRYLRAGFKPAFMHDPFTLLAYVIIQELATQESHGTIARLARRHDPVLNEIMSRIAGEEEAHHVAYLKMYKVLLELDPDHALEVLLHVSNNFEMPGNAMPDFKQLSRLQEQLRAFDFYKHGTILERICNRLSIDNLTGLGDAGKRARDGLRARIARLKKVGERRRNLKQTRLYIPIMDDTVMV